MNLHFISLPVVLFLMVLIPRSLRLAVRCQTKTFIVCVCVFVFLYNTLNCFGRTVLYICIEYHI